MPRPEETARNANRVQVWPGGTTYARITITGITRPVERNADWTYYRTLDFALTTGWDEFEDLLAS